MTTPSRPPEVPADWELVGCANPTCPNTVWVPPFIASGQVGQTKAVGVCSADCALAMSVHL